MLKSIRRWNSEGKHPRFRIGTPRGFFDHLEKRYGKSFPAHRGDWPASLAWDAVKTRGPMAATVYRRAHSAGTLLEQPRALRLRLSRLQPNGILTGDGEVPRGRMVGKHLGYRCSLRPPVVGAHRYRSRSCDEVSLTRCGPAPVHRSEGSRNRRGRGVRQHCDERAARRCDGRRPVRRGLLRRAQRSTLWLSHVRRGSAGGSAAR